MRELCTETAEGVLRTESTDSLLSPANPRVPQLLLAARKRTLQDQDFIRWLEDPDLTIGTQLRLEIAARLRELTS